MSKSASLRLFLTIVTLTVCFFTLSVNTAQAAGPCSVPTLSHMTIQSAVSDSNCDPITVAAGAYPENVIINRTLTLNGAQAGSPVSGRTFGNPLTESTVTGVATMGAVPVFSVRAQNVTIDGFSVTNPNITSGAAIGIGIKVTGPGAVIANNFINGVTTPDTGGNGTAQAVYLEAGPDNVRVVNNAMSLIHSFRSAKGVLIGDSSSTDPSVNITIQGNSMSNITSDSRGAYGVQINNGNGATSNSGLLIQNNTISTLTGGGWVHAIGLEANTPGVVVAGNSISQFVTASMDAISVWFEANPSFSTGHVNRNNFDVTMAAYGIAVHPILTGSPVDGVCNWWGAADGPGTVGPGTGAKVSPNVDFTPWLTAPAPGGPCGGGSTPGKVTGGGQIQSDPIFSPLGGLLSVPAVMPSAAGNGAQATFGFTVKCCAATGNLDYDDHEAQVRIRAQTVDSLIISSPGVSCPAVPGSKHAQFSGTAAVIRSVGTSTEPYTVDVDDCGEPGTADTFGIKTTTYSNGPSTLIGGNIQIH